jgi:tetratricopeptide (TPR) repeat protein
LLNLKTVPPRHLRLSALLFAACILSGPFCAKGHADDNEKKAKEKKERTEVWVEIRTPYFMVISDGGEKNARKVLDQFEAVRRVFQATMPNARLTTGIPIRILAARDAQSFAKLFPEFPADKRHPQPNGDYFSGPEKNYIAIRTNAPGHFPYEGIYQQYARLILKLSYRNLPPWLEEGYANVYGSMTFTDKGARIGRPDPEDMSVLFESPLLPLNLVFHVDRESPYYSAGNKDTVFFAESRALLHMLLTESQISGQKPLDRYIEQLEHGGDAVQAARAVFGDLNQLQNRLDSYVKLINGPSADVAIPGTNEPTGSPRTLSAGEVDARIGEFWAGRGQQGDAQTKLEDALTADPTLALAEQSLGFLLLRKNQLDEADKHFLKAQQLDPNDGLAYYGQGLVAMSRSGIAGETSAAVSAFEKSAVLNPEFAPVWYNLASEYATRPETLQKALIDAQRAAALSPGDSGYQSRVAAIQDSLGRRNEARKAPLGSQAAPNSTSASTSLADLKIINKSPESGAKVPTTFTTVPTPNTTSATTSATPPPLFASGPRIYSMVGTVAEAICKEAPQILLTLKAETIVMHLHADDLGKIAMKSGSSAVPIKNISCTALRGRTVRVSYLLANEKSWDGEIQTIELRNQP